MLRPASGAPGPAPIFGRSTTAAPESAVVVGRVDDHAAPRPSAGPGTPDARPRILARLRSGQNPQLLERVGILSLPISLGIRIETCYDTTSAPAGRPTSISNERSKAHGQGKVPERKAEVDQVPRVLDGNRHLPAHVPRPGNLALRPLRRHHHTRTKQVVLVSADERLPDIIYSAVANESRFGSRDTKRSALSGRVSFAGGPPPVGALSVDPPPLPPSAREIVAYTRSSRVSCHQKGRGPRKDPAPGDPRPYGRGTSAKGGTSSRTRNVSPPRSISTWPSARTTRRQIAQTSAWRSPSSPTNTRTFPRSRRPNP